MKRDPGLPSPGAAPMAGSNRLHGRYALATVSGIATLLCYEWEVNFTLETVDSTGHGDLWAYPVALRQGWTARVRGYFTRSGAATATYIARAGDLTNDPLVVTFSGYSTPGATTAVFVGDGLITRANFSAPMAMATQELEIIGVGPATTGPAA
jgi:hypothetical protein